MISRDSLKIIYALNINGGINKHAPKVAHADWVKLFAYHKTT